MARNNDKSFWKTIFVVLVTLIALAVVFCVVVLIYGACTGMNFVEVLQSWFTPNAVKKAVDEVETTAHILGY